MLDTFKLVHQILRKFDREKYKTITRLMPIDKRSLRSYEEKDYKRKKIPLAVKEQLWIRSCGRVFECDCRISWCQNTMNVFTVHVGHDIPQSKGGKIDMDNLLPICPRCNFSMSNKYTIRQWERLLVN